MFKHNILKLIIASVLIASSATVLAQESVISTATVEVSNAFDLVETQAISFGTITAIGYVNQDLTQTAADIQATIIVPADGSAPSAGTTGVQVDDDAGDSDSAITILTAGQNGLYDISNAAPFTALTVTIPSTPITLAAASAPAGNGTFTMTTFTAVDTSDGSNAATSITTDGTGAAQIGFGATLLTETVDNSVANNLTYIDGNYTGTYTIQVAY